MIKFLGCLWALPTTILAVVLWTLLLLLGQVRPVRWYYEGAWDWEAVGKLRSWATDPGSSGWMWSAMTLGFTILWFGPPSVKNRNHEMRHVRQNMIFGPLWLPLYGLMWFLYWIFNKFDFSIAYWYNPFESDARNSE